MGYNLWLCQQFAIENDPFIVDLPIENGGSFHSYVTVYQRVIHHGKFNTRRTPDVMTSPRVICPDSPGQTI